MDRILIVDDVAMNIRFLGEVLREKYQVLVANNAEKGLQIAQEKQPDLILMDVMMPGMDGFAACRHLKAQPETKDIPLIFITALDKQEDVVKGFTAGGQDYIAKPVNPAELFLRVQTHLELRRSRERIKRYALELEAKNQELNEALARLTELATIDPLTKLANRRSMLEKINEEVSRCQRYGGAFSLGIADVDNFKLVNDTYGHHCGDVVLERIAVLIRRNVRMPDMVARWGGEEFLLLFPETGLAKGRQACEKVREIVAESTICYENQDISVTLTFGVAESTPDFDITAMVRRADEALYRGKEAGKNRVEWQLHAP